MSEQGRIDSQQRDIDSEQREVNESQRKEDREHRRYDETIHDIFKILNGDGLDDPGMKGMVRETYHTLHGTHDTKGLVERVSVLESRDQRQIKFLWYVGSGGTIIGALGFWILSHYGEVTLLGKPIVKSITP